MKQIGSNSIPIPTREKLTRGAYWLAAGALVVMGVNKFGPSVLSAVNTLFDITTAGAALAGVAFVLGVAAAAVWALIPAIRTGINTMAYRSNAFFVNRYPIVQMHIAYDRFCEDIDHDRAAKTRLEEEAAKAKEQVDALQEEINNYAAGAQDLNVSDETREMSVGEVASKSEEIKPYQEILDFVQPLIVTAGQAIDIQVRFAEAFKRDIAVQTARFNASQQLEVIAGVWARNFSARGSLERRNAEAARDAIFAKWGAAKGQVNSMRGQMDAMIRAAKMRDELAAANARRYIEQAARTIEVPMVEVVDARPAVARSTKSYLNIK